MRRRTIYLVIIGLLLAVAWASVGDSLAATGELKKDPADVVKAYLSLDMKGARLEPLSMETLKPYVNWKEEPPWGHVVVIDGYEVSDDIRTWEVVSLLEVVIPVKFRVVGSMYWEPVVFLPDTQDEEVRFRVKAVGDRWRIMEPVYPPHVSQKRFLNFVKQAIVEETDQSRLAKLAELRDELRKKEQ